MFCKICHHAQVAEIDKAVADGEPRRSIAKRFGLRAGALEWHVRKKHRPTESLDDIGDEPTFVEGRGSYDWITRQSIARGVGVPKLLGETKKYDPFYYGSDLDVLKAKWFRDSVVRRFAAQIAGSRPHLRKLHYLCVTAGGAAKAGGQRSEPVLWPNDDRHHGRAYENTLNDWWDLLEYSRIARWLGYVDIESFDDQRNAEPRYYAPSEPADEDEPSVEVGEWPEWELPGIFASLEMGEFTIPQIWAYGFDPDPFLDEPDLIAVFIEKSTMDGWLRPLCHDLRVDLYVGSGTQSITNAARFVRRAIELEKPAHLLVISDFDPTGRKMPIGASRHVDYRHRTANCDVWVTVDSIALLPEQIDKYDLPTAPIKESDPGIRRFEKLYGRGAVELDSMEALHPGVLAEIVEDAVMAYRDGDIEQKLRDADDSVREAISEARAERAGDIAAIRDKFAKVSAKLAVRVKPLRKELEKLKKRLAAKVRRIRPEVDELRAELQEKIDDMVEQVEGVLPERPEPELLTGLPEGVEHLFDSDRGYFDNLASLHRHYPPDPSPPKQRKKKKVHEKANVKAHRNSFIGGGET